MAELKLPFIGHGSDYNPDQWRDRPDILAEDIRLMKLARCNLMSVGIFAWATLEHFQRTRGVLRLMAAVIHELWMANDASATVHRILHSLHHRFQADSTQRSALAGCSRDRLFHRVGDILDQKAEIADICRSTMAL